MREAREREFNCTVKAIVGIRKEIDNPGKELEMDQDKVGIDRDTFASA